MAKLVRMAVGDSYILVEVDEGDGADDGMTFARPATGQRIATAAISLETALDHLEPVVSAIRSQLLPATPDTFSVEFGVKLGGETGVILAKGTGEVSFKVTMTWERQTTQDG